MKNFPQLINLTSLLKVTKSLLLFIFLISSFQLKATNFALADKVSIDTEFMDPDLIILEIIGDLSACPLQTATYAVSPYVPSSTYEWSVIGASMNNNNDGTVTVGFPNTPGSIVTLFAVEKDASGMVVSVSSLAVTLEASIAMSCNDLVNVSLDLDCIATITPDMILEGQQYPDESYSITLTAPGGNIISSNVLDVSHVGLEIMVTITHDCSGNSCWGLLIVEDKNLPTIDCACPVGNTDPACEFNCTDLSILMEGNLSVQQPSVALGCLGYNVDYQDQLIDGVDCGFYTLERTWFVTNNDGLVTDHCKSVYSISPVSFTDIIMPMQTVSLECGTGTSPEDVMTAFDLPFTFDNTSTLHIENNEGVAYAYPHYFQLGHAQAVNNKVCNIIAAYTDQLLEICAPECSNNTKISRTWTLFDWCGGNSNTFIQLIDNSDKIAPTVSGPDLTISTDAWSCVAFVNVPEPTLIHDNCSEEAVVWTASGPAGWDALGLEKSKDNDGDGVIDPYVFTYSATDCCGNIGTSTFNVTILDLVPPTPIAKQNIVLSLTTGGGLGNQGAAKLFAVDVDNGSHDNCGSIKLEVRRPDGSPNCANFGIGQYNNNISFNNDSALNDDNPRDTDNGSFVKFCCEDAVGYNDAAGDYGLHDVILRVHDDANMDGIPGNLGDNYNDTWATIRVENKLPTVLSCQNVTIACYEDHTLPSVAPIPETTGACEAASVVLINTIDNTTACGAGVIVKTWGVDANHDGVVDGATCVQYITLDPSTDVFDGNIQWPLDITTGCLGQTEVQKPNWNDGVCDLIYWSHTDETFTVVVDACWKVLRHFTVQNDCTGEEWTHTQVIKFIDDQDPVLTCQDRVSDAQIDANGNSLCGSYINLTKTVTDPGACPSNTFTWYVEVDLWESGTVDWILTSGQEAYNSSTDNILPIGNTAEVTIVIPELVTLGCTYHSIKYTVSDGCLNTSSCIERFIVVDRVAPLPYCVSISTAVMDNGTVTLWANDFDLGATDDCTDQGDLRFTFEPVLPAASSSLWNADGTTTSKVFTCADADADGLANVVVYVWDDSCIPNSNACNIVLTLSDCATNPPANRIIAGNIETELGDKVSDVVVDLEAEGIANYPIQNLSIDLGDYAFNNVLDGFNYTITGSKEENYMNGVSTLDLVLIQKHILGTRLLDSPYKLIAADINSTETISALDLIELRKLILGIYEELPNNTSWKFIDADQQLSLAFPWNYEAHRDIYNLQMDQLNEDFIGVKIGDVNGSVRANVLAANIASRAERTLSLIVEDDFYLKGDLIEVPVLASDFTQISGFQFTLEHPGLELLSFDSGALAFNQTNVAFISPTVSTISWSNVEPQTTADDELLFIMRFKALEKGSILDRIIVTNAKTQAEAYFGDDYQIGDVKLHSREFVIDDDRILLMQNEPNPFSKLTTIRFSLDQASLATLTVLDIQGRVLKQVSGDYQKGLNTVSIDAEELNAVGLLYYKLESGNQTVFKKMILVN